MKIELTKEEQRLLDTIPNYEINSDAKYEIRIQQLENSEKLFELLYEREAIPSVRLGYFTKPEYNLSNTKKSHFDILGDISLNGNFLKYLKYFIEGAELPEFFKIKLNQIIKENRFEDVIIEKSKPIIRDYAQVNLNKSDIDYFSEEIFKFYIDHFDSDKHISYAKILRDYVKKLNI